ncbi:hypothetical protein ACQWTT_001166 [Acinetobacter baumannii]
MLNFFQKIIDAENIVKHGVFNPDEVIKLQEAAHIRPESLIIKTDGEEYELSSATFKSAVTKLRNNLIFPDISDLPYIEFVDPKISFRQLSTVVDQGLLDDLAQHKIIPLPTEKNRYDLETGTLFFSNHPIKCDEDLNSHLASGRKIVLMINSEQNLVWLTTHEYDAFNKWQDCLADYERKIKLIDQTMKNAQELKSENIRQKGIFKDLPFDVVGAVKINLSGLTERSDGTGRKRNTVKHLLILQKPMHEYSDANSMYHGSVLCSPQKGRHMGLGPSFSLNYAAQSVEDSGITCKTCLSKLKTLLKKHNSQDS